MSSSTCTANFNLADLTNLINIIEVCTQRGAFKAPELEGVGSLYNKLRASHLKLSPKMTNVKESSQTPSQSQINEPDAVDKPSSGDKDNSCCSVDNKCKNGVCPLNS